MKKLDKEETDNIHINDNLLINYYSDNMKD